MNIYAAYRSDIHIPRVFFSLIIVLFVRILHCSICFVYHDPHSLVPLDDLREKYHGRASCRVGLSHWYRTLPWNDVCGHVVI